MKDQGTIRHLLLDIEGTTCPVTFVSEVLFPFASRQLRSYLEEHQNEEAIQKLLEEVEEEMARDADAEDLVNDQNTWRLGRIVGYLERLISADRKVTPLKDLQGRIWEEGYQRRQLIAPLFEDVPGALKHWHNKGLGLSVYSSGSVHAQKLLYGHTEWGDMTDLFSHWFDTRTGAKKTPSSYEKIAGSIRIRPEQILFISDAIAELEAAREAGMNALFSLRAGNPEQDPHDFPSISSFEEIQL